MSSTIQDIARDFHVRRKKLLEVSWVQYTTGFDYGVAEATAHENAVFSDKNGFKIVNDALEGELSPEDRRRAEILRRNFREHHLSDRANGLRKKMDELETKLSDILNKNRVQYQGREISKNEWSKLVTQSEDRGIRREAFLAARTINHKLVDAGFLDLIEMRREFAVALGANDFVSFQLERSELTPDIFDAWKDEIRSRKNALRSTQRSFAQTHLGVEDLAPWDFEFLKNKLCRYNSAPVEIVDFMKPLAKVFSAYGFEISQMNITYDVFPRKNKSEWGALFPVENGRDVRVLTNVDNRLLNYDVLLHETAHGVHFLGLDPDDILMNMGVSGIVSEGFANFFGSLVHSKEFLREVLPGDVDEVVRSFEVVKRIQGLRTFGSLATTVFDQELYRNDLRSIHDIHDLKWSIDRDLLGVEPYADEPLWAQLIHHTTAPIYLHNYYLGDVMCENMKSLFLRRTGRTAASQPREFGSFWREKVLRPSGRYPFLELYEKVCEEKLSISNYLDQCLGGHVESSS